MGQALKFLGVFKEYMPPRLQLYSAFGAESDYKMKISVLEGEWSGGVYSKLIRPLLSKENIPILQHRSLPITYLYSNDFWHCLRITPIDIVTLDWRHWLFENDIFIEYSKKIASIPLKVVCPFESPMGYEYPKDLSFKSFYKLLSDRTKLFVNIIRSEQPNVTILSPAIRVINPDAQKTLLEYFLHHRSYFDAYTVHCCREITDHSLGALSGFLNEALNIIHKPVYVTKWSVPSCEFDITSNRFINPLSGQKPVSHRIASEKMRMMFDTIEEVSQGCVGWYFMGSVDIYHPDKDVPRVYSVLPFQTDHVCKNWEDIHFLGLVDYQGKIKYPILNTLIEMFNVN